MLRVTESLSSARVPMANLDVTMITSRKQTASAANANAHLADRLDRFRLRNMALDDMLTDSMNLRRTVSTSAVDLSHEDESIRESKIYK